tara:strand:+ start:524 stop:1978 length:1455 start_codon:yes stop_codon:yes gene_type:complete
MGGGLMQLVAYGAQDIYLTGNPQITFFKVVYRRHTNFSMESIKQVFDGNANFGGDVVATISRNGDLVHRMYLEHDALFTSLSNDNDFILICSNYGSNLIKECELEIGGQRIDKHYSHWHSVYHQLTEFNPSGAFQNGVNHPVLHQNSDYPVDPVIKSTLFNTMSGNGGAVTTGIISEGHGNSKLGSWVGHHYAAGHGIDTAQTKIFIPLYFWFCRNPGLALPLIALQYHEVKVKMTFDQIINLVTNVAESHENANDLWASENGSFTFADPTITSPDFNLWCDYIYLDTDERRRFAQVSHEYLIEQVQYQSFSSSTNLDLNFNHPVKELIWTSSVNISPQEPNPNTNSINNFMTVFTTHGISQGNQIKISANREPRPLTGDFQLKLNGHDRFKKRDTKYFTRTQIWQHHTGYGSIINSDAIAVYSFALKPEEHQPSGTCNFSRIDNAQLISTDADGDDPNYYNVYAINYNVLRIMSGMGGLAYSN